MVYANLLFLTVILLNHLKIVLLERVSKLVLLYILVNKGFTLYSLLTDVLLDSHDVESVNE